MNNIKKIIIEKLKSDDRIWDDSQKELNETLLLDLVDKMDEEIIDSLFQDENLREKFFVKIKDVYVFKTNDFRFFIEENKVDNSFTSYKNRIGLSDGKRFLKDTNDVVLNYPFKDCVLEGGQSTEEGTDTYFEYDKKAEQYEEKQGKRKEIFFNQVLAHDEIDRLFDAKALTNWKRFTKDGEEEVKEIKRDIDGTIKENLIIKGNNLLALHSLKKQFAGKVKLIYIDPPYNTGNDGFKYNDNFNHSTWLTFMKNRLEVARELLRDDGVIFVHLDHNEIHYCRILLDDIFGRNNFQREIVWFKGNTFGYAASANNFVLSHDSILFYSKNYNFTFYKQYVSYSNEYLKKRFIHDDKDGKGKYRLQGKNQKQYLNDSKGTPIPDVWQIPVVNVMAIERHLDTQKPEAVIEKIIKSATKNGDIVLDYHLGSGTTCAVAHKMGRQYIGIEQMDYIKTIAVERLKKIIDGEQGGISKSVNWQGGGDFIYFELAKWNEIAKEKIIACESLEELITFFDEMYERYFLSYNLKIKEFREKVINEEEFKNLSLDEHKKIFVAMLDNNQMYVNKTEMADKKFGIGEEDQNLTSQFYNGEK